MCSVKGIQGFGISLCTADFSEGGVGGDSDKDDGDSNGPSARMQQDKNKKITHTAPQDSVYDPCIDSSKDGQHSGTAYSLPLLVEGRKALAGGVKEMMRVRACPIIQKIRDLRILIRKSRISVNSRISLYGFLPIHVFQ